MRDGAADSAGDAVRRVQVALGDVQHAVPEAAQRAVAGGVAAVRARRAVHDATIDLDDEPLGVPEEIGLPPTGDPRVHLRLREGVVAHDVEHAHLDARARGLPARVVGAEQPSQDRGAAAATGTLERLIDLRHVDQAQLLRADERASHMFCGDDVAEVDERAGEGGDAQPVTLGDVLLGELRAVDAQAAPGSAAVAREDRDVLGAAAERADVPLRRRCLVAADGAVAAREHRGPAVAGR